MKRLLGVFLLLLLAASAAQAAYVQFSVTATTRAGTPLRGYTVTVYNYPAGTKASIYSDGIGTVKANPFLTSTTDGTYSFYTGADGDYRIVVTKPGMSGTYDMKYINVTGTTVLTSDIDASSVGLATLTGDADGQTMQGFVGANQPRLELLDATAKVYGDGATPCTETVGATTVVVACAATTVSTVDATSARFGIALGIPKAATLPTCNAALAGTGVALYYDTTGPDLCICNGTSWAPVDGSGTCA